MSNGVHAAADGCPSDFVPPVGNEINRLVSNVTMGRSWAGIHYRSDSTSGIRLEDVAISILQDDLVQTCTEEFDGFAFTRYDGTAVRMSRGGMLS